MALLQTIEDKEFAAQVKTIARSLKEQKENAERKAVYDLTMQILVSGRTDDVRIAYGMAKDWIGTYKGIDKSLFV